MTSRLLDEAGVDRVKTFCARLSLENHGHLIGEMAQAITLINNAAKACLQSRRGLFSYRLPKHQALLGQAYDASIRFARMLGDEDVHGMPSKADIIATLSHPHAGPTMAHVLLGIAACMTEQWSIILESYPS